jgi:phenylalanyl-tRNA synthetase beta chain
MKEEIRLTGIISGNERKNSVHSENDVTNIFSIKGVIKTILGDDYFNDLEFSQCDKELYENGYDIIYAGKVVGFFGKLSKKIFSLLKVGYVDVYGFDISTEQLKGISTNRNYIPINTLPKISRKINLVMDNKDSIVSILGLIKEKGGVNLIDYYPVETFEDSDNLGVNKKSVVFEMIFQHKEKTLEDKDVNPIIDEIIDIAQSKFNAKLRV